MSIISKILITLSALLFFYIMYLETVASTSQATSRVFSISREQLAEPKFNTLMKNQGGLQWLYWRGFTLRGLLCLGA